jgi:hypothetical protein
MSRKTSHWDQLDKQLQVREAASAMAEMILSGNVDDSREFRVGRMKLKVTHASKDEKSRFPSQGLIELELQRVIRSALRKASAFLFRRMRDENGLRDAVVWEDFWLECAIGFDEISPADEDVPFCCYTIEASYWFPSLDDDVWGPVSAYEAYVDSIPEQDR